LHCFDRDFNISLKESEDEYLEAKKGLKKVFKSLNPGDLVCVEWCDASVGKSSGSGVCIDVPVKSWGIYVGLFGERAKHIVLAQKVFDILMDYLIWITLRFPQAGLLT
jgi:hypothetical protein